MRWMVRWTPGSSAPTDVPAGNGYARLPAWGCVCLWRNWDWLRSHHPHRFRHPPSSIPVPRLRPLKLFFRRMTTSSWKTWSKPFFATSGSRPIPQTGLVKDRCNARKASTDNAVVASIAATGFGLSAICIGEKRGYISLNEARARVLNSLRFLWKTLPNHRGFFYHFANVNTGERLWDSEISSVDTAILLCGILSCRQHFENSEIRDLAREIFDRVDWTWLSEDTTLLPHGWLPEAGFLPYRWDYYSELMMMYLLGMGSSSHPLKPQTWDAWKRNVFEYDGLRYIGSFAPLFVHQYSQAWFDFRGKSATATPTTFRTPPSPPTCIAASAWNWRNSFPTTATTCGASPLRIRKRVTWSGAVRRRSARSTEPWFPAPPAVRCHSCRNRSCAFSATSGIITRWRLEHVRVRECLQPAEAAGTTAT